MKFVSKILFFSFILIMNINFYKKYLKYKNKYINLKRINQNGGSNRTIDLTNIKPNTQKKENKSGITVYANYENYQDKEFSPMFENPLNAKKLSPTMSVHLVVPGLLPASDKSWIDYNKNKIFYMPNDLTPHFHGEAQHHMPSDGKSGFEISQVFLLSKMSLEGVENKRMGILIIGVIYKINNLLFKYL